MVSETINIYLARAEEPVTGGADWRARDKAYYNCKFTLRNLTDQTLTVPVGFPLEGENYILPRYHKEKRKIDQTNVIARFNFIAGTSNGTYPIRYIQHDKSKKYKKLFLWDMTFKPQETIELTVSYCMSGYHGLGVTQKRPYIWSSKRYGLEYLASLDGCVTGSFGYVTSTANSWSGPIEKAKFTVHQGKFEKYLRTRGYLEIDEDYIYYKKHQKMIPFCALYRHISPKGWKEEGEKNKRTIVWEYKDFKPEKDILISYSFLYIPENVSQCKRIIDEIKKKYERKRNALLKAKSPKAPSAPPAWNKAIEKNIADIFLEYYGVNTKNEAIAKFLKKQQWHPVKNPPPIDEKLKEYLLKLDSI
jgi:hypothetical protein